MIHRGFIGAALVAALTLFHFVPAAAILALVMALWHLVDIPRARGPERVAALFLFRTELYAAILLGGLFVWSLSEFFDNWRDVETLWGQATALTTLHGRQLTDGITALLTAAWDQIHFRFVPMIIHEVAVTAITIWLLVRIVRGWLRWNDRHLTPR